MRSSGVGKIPQRVLFHIKNVHALILLVAKLAMQAAALARARSGAVLTCDNIL